MFCLHPDEMSEILPGLRLRALSWWNLGASVRDNFFKSAFFSFHGLSDVSFYYLAGWALSSLFRQPLAGTSYHFGYNWRQPE